MLNGIDESNQCTAISKRSKQRCCNPAVDGYNVCRMHGAGSPSRGTSPAVIKHGMYSSKVNTKLAEYYNEFLYEVDNIEAMKEDIALLRAMMAGVLSEEYDDEMKKDKQIAMALRIMDDIRTSVNMKDKLENKFNVSIETVQVFLNQLIFILKKHILDDVLLNKIIADMKQVKLLDQPNR